MAETEKAEAQARAAQPLKDAIRDARIEAAERSAVVVDMRDADLARLEILNDALDPVFAEVPAGVDLFDRGISRGDTPRLWIDVLAHVAMGRDKRLYRFVQDTRYGRTTLAESYETRDIADAAMKMAFDAHRLLGCKGTSRSDFRWDDEKGEAGLYLLEVNTQPGMTPLSLVPEQARHVGMSYADLVQAIVDEAMAERQEK